MKIREPLNGVVLSEARNDKPAEDLKQIDRYPSGGKDRELWIKKAVPYLRAFIAEGLTRDEIKNRLGIADMTYDRLEKILLESEATKLESITPAHHYYLYVLHMEYASRQLDKYISLHMNDATGAGVVSAIKAKAQLHQDVLRVGQDMGVISKKSREIRLLGEINLSKMPTEELKDLFITKLKSFADVVAPRGELPPAYDNMLRNALHRNVKRDDEYIEVEYDETH